MSDKPRRKPVGLVQRAAATEKTMARFRHRAFDWGTGATCLHLARAQMKNMGYRPPAIPRFTSALGARRALAQAGFDSVSALLDSMLPRIAPAAMLVGDLAAFPGEAGFECVAVSAGAGMMLGWHGEDLSRVQNVVDWEAAVIGAWRL
jgi:hypothetical protein